MKILIGVIDVAGQALLFSEGFKAHGYKVTTFIRGQHKNFSNDKFDILIKRKYFKYQPFKILYQLYCYGKYILVASLAVMKHDIFLFQAGISFFNGYDLPILKLLKKKVIMFHNGSDIRWWPAFHQILLFRHYRYSYCPSLNDIHQTSLKRTLKTIRRSEKYSTVLQAGYDSNIFGIKPYFSWGSPIDTSKYCFNIPNNIRVKIIHCPSFPLPKGSIIIRKAIDSLIKDGYQIDFIELFNTPHMEVKSILSDADILIEQVGQIINGKNALEGLASGCLVFSDVEKSITNYNMDLPVIPIRAWNIIEVLKEYLDDRSLWKEPLEKAIPCLKKYYEPKIIAKAMIDALENKVINQNLYHTPDFLVKDYYPFDEKSTKLINKYTRKIKKCSWYPYNSSNNRDGLEF